MDTSAKAFQEGQASGSFARIRNRIYNIIEKCGPIHYNEITRKLIEENKSQGYKTQATYKNVSARVSELSNCGAVKVDSFVVDEESGKTVKVWKVTGLPVVGPFYNKKKVAREFINLLREARRVSEEGGDEGLTKAVAVLADYFEDIETQDLFKEFKNEVSQSRLGDDLSPAQP
jgi:hypothetical protein